MTVERLLDLYAHMRWADGEVWDSVLSSEACAGDERILATLHHLHTTQLAFLDVWLGREFEFRRRDGEDAAAVRALADTFHDQVRAYLGSVRDDALGGELTVPWTKYFEKRLGRSAGRVKLGESMYQVVSHSMHHRGQVSMLIRELGADPPLVDYIVWLWLDRPT
ncbi:MAG: damage-inducible protein DinB [Rhodothermales bacterium]|nr:damage-inducible protein DinB [Rhodothermales bacterium]